MATPLADIAARLGIGEDEAAARLASARAKLLAAREQAHPPGPRRQDPHLVERAHDRRHGARRARLRPRRLARLRAARARLRPHHDVDGRAPARHAQGRQGAPQRLPRRPRLPARGPPRGDAGRLPARTTSRGPRRSATRCSSRFHDEAGGGFFFTSHDHERLIHRPKPGHDNATPSGNGVAAWALNRLAFLSGETRFRRRRRGHAVPLLAPPSSAVPAGFGSLLAALEETLSPPTTVIVNGPQAAFAPWREALRRDYLPSTLVVFVGDHGRHTPAAGQARRAGGQRVGVRGR